MNYSCKLKHLICPKNQYDKNTSQLPMSHEGLSWDEKIIVFEILEQSALHSHHKCFFSFSQIFKILDQKQNSWPDFNSEISLTFISDRVSCFTFLDGWALDWLTGFGFHLNYSIQVFYLEPLLFRAEKS